MTFLGFFFLRTSLSTKLVFQLGLGNSEECSCNFSLDWQPRAFLDKNKALLCQMVDFSRIKNSKGYAKSLLVNILAFPELTKTLTACQHSLNEDAECLAQIPMSGMRWGLDIHTLY